MSRVDVVVPCYNYAHFLPTCVRSILDQSLRDVRVLIIDDASNDNSAEVAQALAHADRRVEFLRHAANRGHIATYNEGLEWASGDYLLLLSADDWLIPGALARSAHVMDGDPNVVLTCGNAVVASHDGSCAPIPQQGDTCAFTVTAGPDFIAQACDSATESPLWTPTAIVRTAVQKKVGGYSSALPHAGDLEMWLRFAFHGSIARLDAYQAAYRRHQNNMHYATNAVVLGNIRQHLAAFDSAFAANAGLLRNAAELQERYRRCFAKDAVVSAEQAFDSRAPQDCKAYLEFACEIWPAVRRIERWRRLRLKRLLGWRAARVARVITQVFRPTPAA